MTELYRALRKLGYVCPFYSAIIVCLSHVYVSNLKDVSLREIFILGVEER